MVDLYHKVSPLIAEFITRHPSAKPIVQAGLTPAVATSIMPVNTAPADKEITLSLSVLALVALAIRGIRRQIRDRQHTLGRNRTIA